MANGATYTHADIPYDYAIGGLPFNSAAGKDNPIARQTSPVQKQQQDIGVEPGEQSLGFWWSRSQSSFHGGAGQEFLDGQAQDDSRHLRFYDSDGVDVFAKPGQVSLLPQLELVDSGDYRDVIPAFRSGFNRLLYSRDTGTGTEFGLFDAATHARTVLQTLAGVTTNTNFMVSDGTNYYYIQTLAGVATVQRAAIAGGAGTAMYTLPSSGTFGLYYVKSRLMLTVTGTCYELSTTATAAALPTPLVAGLNGGGVSNLVEAADGIYCFSVSAPDLRFYIGYIGEDTSGGTPVLVPPVQVAALSAGELPLSLYQYLGYLAIGTVDGLRMAKVGGGGAVTLGPQLFHGRQVSLSVGAGRYLFACTTNSVTGKAGLVKVDLSYQIPNAATPYSDSLRFVYANDMTTVDTGGSGNPIHSAVPTYDRMVVVDNFGIHVQSLTKKVTTASLTTSKIRFSTTEPKLFRQLSLSVGASADVGGVSGEFIYPDGTSSGAVASAVSVSGGLVPQTVTGNASGVPNQWLQVKVTFTNTAGGSGDDKILYSFVVRALPAPRRQRVLQIPLKCFDRELSNNQRVFRSGTALSRLLALEALEAAGDVVNFQTLGASVEDRVTTPVIIEQIAFQQTSEPKDREGFGGVITVTMRTVS